MRDMSSRKFSFVHCAESTARETRWNTAPVNNARNHPNSQHPPVVLDGSAADKWDPSNSSQFPYSFDL